MDRTPASLGKILVDTAKIGVDGGEESKLSVFTALKTEHEDTFSGKPKYMSCEMWKKTDMSLDIRFKARPHEGLFIKRNTI